MAKPTRQDLIDSVNHYQNLWLLLAWALRQEAVFPSDTYVVIQRPRSGPLVARTDEYGVPQYSIEPDDTDRVRREFSLLSSSSDDSGRLSRARDYDRLTQALLECRQRGVALPCGHSYPDDSDADHCPNCDEA